MIPELTENPFHFDYIPTGTGKKKPHNKYRKPPSRLAIYKQQEFYEPMTDGASGHSDRAEESEPYQAEMDRQNVETEDDQDEDPIF
jgi:hypothetical protein